VIEGYRGDAVQSPALDQRNSFAQHLFTPLGRRYDRLAELLSFGQNGRWRRAMVDRINATRQPGEGLPVVLDVAAGTAGVSLQLAARTGARVIGLDLTEQMLRQGARNVAAAGADDSISLVSGRAEQLPLPDAAVDALTFTYLLRYVSDPQATLAELARVVRPGGTIASLEFLVPPSAFWRPAARRPADRWPGVVRGRQVPRPQHCWPLPPLPGGLDGPCMAAGWLAGRGLPGHEPRRWPRHVGNARE
jgi:ubiquinone/menaquinone biosynthesis methyltransferase